MGVKIDMKYIQINDNMFKSYKKENTNGFAEEIMRIMKNDDLIPVETGNTIENTKIVRKNVSAQIETVNYSNWSLEYGGYSWYEIDGSQDRYNSMGRNKNYGKTRWLHKGRKKASKTYRPKGKMNQDWKYSPRG